MTMRNPHARLTFDAAAWDWLVAQGPVAVAEFLARTHGLLDDLGMRGHVWGEQGETPDDLRIAMRFRHEGEHGP